MLVRSLFVLGLAACASEEPAPLALEGSLGFEVLGGLALVCPEDAQGQFIKVFVEGPGPTSACLDQGGRPMPLTCEARRAYLQADPRVCLGAPAAPGEHLPMLDLLLQEEEGLWSSFDYASLTYCAEGADERVELFGAIDVIQTEGAPTLSFDLASEGSGVHTLAGEVALEVCEL
ncbi:MAG: hypothetical protein EP330_09640 [Deltaproteobacteria bacterium]|nr:MAG: hypothetical protein EP330_09640 [Deltaproteobacteria bacterium]